MFITSNTSSVSEPIGIFEYIALGLGAFCFLASFVAMGIAFAHSNYRPLKSKQLLLVFITLTSGCLWWFGSVVVYGLVPVQGSSIFRLCELWCLWIQLVFGALMMISVCSYRLWKLHRLLIQEKQLDGLFYWSISVMLFSPSMIVALMIIFLRSDEKVVYLPETGRCQFHNTFKYTLWGIAALSLLPFAYLAMSLVSVRKSLNEFKQNRIILIASGIALCISLFLVICNLHLTRPGRIWIPTSILLTVQFYFWLPLYRPLFAALFYPEPYLLDFNMGLFKTPPRVIVEMDHQLLVAQA